MGENEIYTYNLLKLRFKRNKKLTLVNTFEDLVSWHYFLKRKGKKSSMEFVDEAEQSEAIQPPQVT